MPPRSEELAKPGCIRLKLQLEDAQNITSHALRTLPMFDLNFRSGHKMLKFLLSGIMKRYHYVIKRPSVYSIVGNLYTGIWRYQKYIMCLGNIR